MAKRNLISEYIAKHPENTVWTPETGWQDQVMDGYVVVDGGTDETDSFTDYGDAVHFLNNIATDYQRDGYTVEHGWASSDNLSAVKVSAEGVRVFYLSIEIDQS
jgi:hypothetical protein